MSGNNRREVASLRILTNQNTPSHIKGCIEVGDIAKSLCSVVFVTISLMSDSVVPKRLVPYALVSPLQPHKSDDGQPQNESRKRKRVADMTSEERAEKQLKRYVINSTK